MQNQSPLDRFFHLVSKMVMAIPLLILLAAVIIQFQQRFLAPSQVVIPTPLPRVSPTQIAPTVSSTANLNLTGPFLCQPKGKEKIITAYIKNKNVLVEYSHDDERDNFLIKGDCFYNWDEGERKGEKVCGVSSYLTLAESLSAMNIISVDSILGMLPELANMEEKAAKPAYNNTELFKEVAESCEKKEVVDTVFQLPKNVVFSEKKVTGVPKQP